MAASSDLRDWQDDLALIGAGPARERRLDRLLDLRTADQLGDRAGPPTPCRGRRARSALALAKRSRRRASTAITPSAIAASTTRSC